MKEVKFVYTGYINVPETEDDVMEWAIEHVREEFNSQVADFAEFTIEGDDGTSFKGVQIMCGDHIQPITECRCLL
jgi:hypothetical protein